MTQLNRLKPLVLADLIPTHNRLRSPERLKSIINNKFSPPNISLVDGKYYIHDGHHRLVCMFFLGYREITDYILTEFKTNDYNEINLSMGYVTPFDIKTECRLPEFFKFKEIILSHDITDLNAEAYIRRFENYYCEKRTVFSLEQLFREVSFAL